MASSAIQEGDKDIELGLISPSSKHNPPSDQLSQSPALVLSNSGKRILDQQAGKKKYVKQVTGRHNDTELHLAAQKGDLVAVKQILDSIDAQITGQHLINGAELDHEVAEIQGSVVDEVNQIGETALYIAADRGHFDVVKELLKYSNMDTLTRKAGGSNFDPLHIAASQGHNEIVKLLLEHEPGLIKTIGTSNATPLITAAIKGHVAVVNELLTKDRTLLEMCKKNDKNALHLAARRGHVETVNALLERDSHLARRNDKKGQTALHMAAKGTSSEVVRLLLEADAAIVMLPDKNGNTALHVATRKKRHEIVNELLRLPDTNVNALTRDHKTALDIAEDLPQSEESEEIKTYLLSCGAVRANELNQPRELRKTVSQIKKDVHTQLEQTKRTNKNVHGIAKELRKLHREGINNATNSVTVVAVLFATVAFAAIFTVPGGNDNNGLAVVVNRVSFKIFFVFNAFALFTSLAVVVVQITLVRGETKAETKVVEIINKLMWLASVCTSVAFMSASYIVIGRRYEWAAILVTSVGGVIMGAVLGTMTYYVVKSKRLRSMRKKVKSSRTRSTGSNSGYHSEFSNSDIDKIFAL